MTFGKLKIGAKINLSLLAVVFLPLIVILTMMFLQVKRNTDGIVRRNLGAMGEEIGQQVDIALYSAHAYLQSLAETPGIRANWGNATNALAEMKALMEVNDTLSDLLIVNLEGEVVVSTHYAHDGAMWTGAFFDWRRSRCYTEALGGEQCMAQARATKSPFWLLVVAAAPIRGADGEIKAILGGRVNIKKIWGVTDRVNRGGRLQSFIVDPEGTIVAHANEELLLSALEPTVLREAILAEESGSKAYTTLKGHKRICSWGSMQGHEGYKGLGWKIAMTQDYRKAFGLVEKMQAQVAAFSVVCFIFLFVLGGLLSRNIVAPILSLVRATESLAEGNLGSRVDVTSGDELGRLGESFNKMAGDLQSNILAREKAQAELQKSHDMLEVRVQERTADLVEANKKVKSEYEQRLDTEEKLRESERQRVMLQSLGAATHHLGQPATVLVGHLGILKRLVANLDPKILEHLEVSMDAAKTISQVIHKLHAVDEYKTTDYLTKEGGGDRDQILDLGLDVPKSDSPDQ